MENLKSSVKQYLCTNCCSHRVIRTQKTAPGCVDVMNTYHGLRNEDVVVPPKENHEKFFQMHSFVCGCKKKALICETDKFSEFSYTKDHRALDPRLPETELFLECIIACNLKVLQVKTLDDDLTTQKRHYAPNFGVKNIEASSDKKSRKNKKASSYKKKKISDGDENNINLKKLKYSDTNESKHSAEDIEDGLSYL